jgi:hypothetical protein
MKLCSDTKLTFLTLAMWALILTFVVFEVIFV